MLRMGIPNITFPSSGHGAEIGDRRAILEEYLKRYLREIKKDRFDFVSA